MNNEEFAELVKGRDGRPRSRRSAATEAGPVPLGPEDTDDIVKREIAREDAENKRLKAEKRRKEAFEARAEKRAKKAEEPREKEDAGPQYRDRAAERRQTDGEVAGSVDFGASAMTSEESRFLGGDVEHTHLVKGLDYALLKKVRREQESKRPQADKDQPHPAPKVKEDKVRILAAVDVWERMLARDRNAQRSAGAERFLPRRTSYMFDVKTDILQYSFQIPAELQRSRADCPVPPRRIAATVDTEAEHKLHKVMNHVRARTGKKTATKRRSRAMGKHAPATTAVRMVGELLPQDAGEPELKPEGESNGKREEAPLAGSPRRQKSQEASGDTGGGGLLTLFGDEHPPLPGTSRPPEVAEAADEALLLGPPRPPKSPEADEEAPVLGPPRPPPSPETGEEAPLFGPPRPPPSLEADEEAPLVGPPRPPPSTEAGEEAPLLGPPRPPPSPEEDEEAPLLGPPRPPPSPEAGEEAPLLGPPRPPPSPEVSEQVLPRKRPLSPRAASGELLETRGGSYFGETVRRRRAPEVTGASSARRESKVELIRDLLDDDDDDDDAALTAERSANAEGAPLDLRGALTSVEYRDDADGVESPVRGDQPLKLGASADDTRRAAERLGSEDSGRKEGGGVNAGSSGGSLLTRRKGDLLRRGAPQQLPADKGGTGRDRR